MTLQEFLEQTSSIKNPEDIDIVLQVDGLDDDAYFIEYDKHNLVLRIFGE